MVRFFYVIFRNFFRACIYIPGMDYIAAHPKGYSKERRYRIVQRVLGNIQRAGRIHTKSFGVENLPEKGGYIMFPNHQGKYDALGIFLTHEAPCSIVMDGKKAKGIFLKQIMAMLNGLGMEIDNVRQSMEVILEVGKRAAQGERFIIFPEGGYTDNHNNVKEFKPGAFKSAMIAKCPIVPVALVDSYKAFEGWSLRKVTTKVIYLPPIPYEEYKDMKTVEISEMVKKQIMETIEKFVSVQP